VNETEIETTREPRPSAPIPAERCRRTLTQPTLGWRSPPRWRASRPLP
jgi:hypothetical protein